jgi:transcription elongation factor Elf1
MMVGSSGMTGGGGVKERKIRVTCPECGNLQEEYIQVIEHKKETVCKECGHRFQVVH